MKLKTRSQNPLDVLAREIKKDFWLEGLEEEASHPKPEPRRESIYANPDNWTSGIAVRLVHNEEGPLGVYQEYYHILSPSARRLLPAVAGVLPVRDELVFGEYWLHPKFSAPEVDDSQLEIEAIRQRFSELMNEFGWIR